MAANPPKTAAQCQLGKASVERTVGNDQLRASV